MNIGDFFFLNMYQRAVLPASSFTLIARVGRIVHETRIPFYHNFWIRARSVFFDVLCYTLLCMMQTYKLTFHDNKHMKIGSRRSINLMMMEKGKYMTNGLYFVLSVSLERLSVLVP